MFILMEARDYLKEQEFIILGHSTGLSFKVYSNKVHLILIEYICYDFNIYCNCHYHIFLLSNVDFINYA